MKKARTLFSLLVVLATVFALLTVGGCSSSAGDPPKTTTDYYKTVMNYSPFSTMPDITYEMVLNKYMEKPGGSYSGNSGKYSVYINGTVTSLQQKVNIKFTVTDDPDDQTKCFIHLDYVKINDEELDPDTSLNYLYELCCAYNAGCDDLSQWEGSEQNSSTGNDVSIPDNDRKIVEEAGFEWVEPITVENGDITGVIKNVSGETKSATIEFVLYDESGYQVSTAVDMMNSIGNGSSWKFEAAIMDFDNKVRSYELVALHTF
ncbi:MAG: FxLYD domain-containing protein [Oscillospiraceae bacterium]|nr:FxLYD domain-containing protein [Oscillospiraceae bacterium]